MHLNRDGSDMERTGSVAEDRKIERLKWKMKELGRYTQNENSMSYSSNISEGHDV